jgi:hypothetical protein
MRSLKDAMRRLGDIETRPDEVVALAAPDMQAMNIDVAVVNEKMFTVAKQTSALRLRADVPPELL